MFLITNFHPQNFPFPQIFPSRPLSVNTPIVSLSLLSAFGAFHVPSFKFQVIVNVIVIVDGRFLLFFLFCKVRPARAVERSTSAAASLLAGYRWIAFDTAVQSTDALQKSGFPQVFVKSLSLCVFVFQLK